MNKRLKEFAEQSGLCIADNRDGRALVFGGQLHVHVLLEELERFAELVRADEREACAKLCESMGVHPALNVWGGGPEWYQRQKECATEIRARGNHEQN